MSDSPTSDIGMMYRQLLQSRGVPLTGENMQRVVAESRRTPGLIPGLTVQGEDPPNQAAAGMPTQPGVPNSGVAPPLAPQPTAPLPVPPAPPSYGGLPVVDNMHPGATSPGGVIPGTGVTPGSMPTVGPQAATPSSPMGSMPSAPMPSPASGGTDSSDIAQMVLGLLAGGGAGLAPLFAQQSMGNAGHAPFTINPDRQAPTTRSASQPTSRSSGLNVGESGNAANDIELDMGAKTQSPKDTSERTGGQSAGDRGGDNFPSDSGVHGGAVVKTERSPPRIGRSPTFRGIRIR